MARHVLRIENAVTDTPAEAAVRVAGDMCVREAGDLSGLALSQAVVERPGSRSPQEKLMTALLQGGTQPVKPDVRLRLASVWPVTSSPLGWSGIRAEHLSSPADCEVDVAPTTHDWLVLNHGRATRIRARVRRAGT
jgi:hypothetical protein